MASLKPAKAANGYPTENNSGVLNAEPPFLHVDYLNAGVTITQPGVSAYADMPAITGSATT